MTRPAGLSTISVGGIPFKMCLFFTRNPDETLQTTDIAAKYRTGSQNVHGLLRRAVIGGWLAHVSDGSGRGKQATYSAGPELRKLIGVE
jgi:hypothetical protein